MMEKMPYHPSQIMYIFDGYVCLYSLFHISCLVLAVATGQQFGFCKHALSFIIHRIVFQLNDIDEISFLATLAMKGPFKQQQQQRIYSSYRANGRSKCMGRIASTPQTEEKNKR